MTEQDEDRAAILARRRRFIALALGSLATGCGPDKPAPKPDSSTGENSSSTTGDESESGSGDESESGSGDESESGSETAPMPCLKHDLPPDETDSDETDSGSDTGTPRPCLVPPG